MELMEYYQKRKKKAETQINFDRNGIEEEEEKEIKEAIKRKIKLYYTQV